VLKISHAVTAREDKTIVTSHSDRYSGGVTREQLPRDRIDAIAEFRRRRLGLRDCAARK
jgi:hypothetical protein